MRRELTATERYWIEEALIQEPTLSAEDRGKYKLQIPKLRVVEECDCGDPTCGSIKFSHYVRGLSYGFADAVIDQGSPEEMRVAIFINHESDKLSEIETIK